MPAPFSLAMVEGGGVLQLRGVEPFSLDAPTIVSGTVDVGDDDAAGTGAFRDGTFSTPDVHLEMDIDAPLVATVVVDVTFSQTSPGNLVGSVDSDGNVVIQTALEALLDIEVQPLGGGVAFMDSVCRSWPIELLLQSVAPYDPDTGVVTVTDADFTVPPVAQESACLSVIGGAVNDLIAGSGHALTLTLEGDLEIPEPPGQPSVTTLVVTPSGTSVLGAAVTLAATVAPGEGAEGDATPGGLVDFLDGEAVLGTVALVDGQASLDTADLPVGARELRARYRGGDGVYGRSSSEVAAHTVMANPAVLADVPEFLYVGGPAQEFTVTAVNTGFGLDIANARIDVTIERLSPSLSPLTPNRVILERQDGDGDWHEIVLTEPEARVLVGSVGPAAGEPLPVGAEVSQRLRVTLPLFGTQPPSIICQAPHATCPGQVKVSFDVVAVAPDLDPPAAVRSPAPGALATGSTEALIVASTRRVPSFLVGAPAVTPAVARQGGMVTVPGLRWTQTTVLSGYWPQGEIAVDVAGQPAGVRKLFVPSLEAGWPTTVPTVSGALQGDIFVRLPAGLAPGEHTLVVRYLGSPNHEPVSFTTLITVAPRSGALFECTRRGLDNAQLLMVHVAASADLPTYWRSGAALDVANLDVQVLFSRSHGVPALLGETMGSGAQVIGVPFSSDGDVVEDVALTFGALGVGGAVGYDRTGDTPMVDPADPVIDQAVTFTGEHAELTVIGEPGASVPILLDRVTITARVFLGALSGPTIMDCSPVDGPVALGAVTVVGTSVEVSSSRVREGQAVAVSAVSLPATPGLVEFRSGGSSIGLVAVDAEGRATTTTTLAQGVHEITARFLGGLGVPSTTSPPVEVTVLPPWECAAFAQEGNGAVVRLVYMELLGRCPDSSGFTYWTARLDGGTSPESFARSIARTPEAVGVVVDDAYQTVLGRHADPGGRDHWVGRMTSGAGRYDRLLADLAGSGEFWTLAGATNTGFVTRVYDRLLGRAPEQAGLDHWVGRLDAGVSPRALVVGLANLDEPLGAQVTGSYQQILARPPTSAERSVDIALLRATGDRPGLFARLIGTPEFTQRAQDFPNPED